MIRCLPIVLLLAASPQVMGQGGGKAGPQVEFRVTRFDPADRESPVFRVGTLGHEVDVEVPLTYIGGPYKAHLREGGFLDFWRGEGEKPEISLTITEAERVPKSKKLRSTGPAKPLGSQRALNMSVVEAHGFSS